MNTDLAVIFDMNGVIVDDASYHDKAFFAFCDKHGIDITLESMKKNVHGRMNKNIFPFLMGRALEPDELSEYAEEKEEAYRDLYRPDMQAMAGLIALFEDLKLHGVPMAVATSSTPENANFILDGLGIREFFNAVVDSSQIYNGKPDPEIFTTAAKLLGVPAGVCVGFEDSLSGLAALSAAQMKAIGVATNHEVSELLPHAQKVVKDFSGLNYQALLSLHM